MQGDKPLDREEPNAGEETPQGRRLRGFARHLGAYFLFCLIAVPINLFYTPDSTWVILPVVIWGAPLALHAAWAMGLLDGLFGDGRGDDGGGPER